MPGNTFAMSRLGIAFGSVALKPLSYSASGCPQRPIFALKGPSSTVAGFRHCSSTSKPKPGSGSGHHASASELSLKQPVTLTAAGPAATSGISSPVPAISISSSNSSSLNSPMTSPESIANTIREGGDVVMSFKAGDPEEYFDLSRSFTRSEKWKSKLVSTMLVYPNFISEQEEDSILKEIEPYIGRLHYENSHWDDAIHEYRETERSKWNKKNEVVINRIRELAFPPGIPQLKLVHILDLAKKGLIKPHIDSIRFCGNTITGLSLLSNCVMRLKHDVQTDFFCDVYLPRFSLYVMKDFARYEFTHEILGTAESMFKKKEVTRDRRVSIICRNEPEATTGPVFKPLM